MRRKPGIIVPVLVGPAAKINNVAREHKIDIGAIEIVDVAHSDAAAAKAVELIRAGKGEMLMKGSLHTDELMRAVTAAETGLRTARRISHVFIMDVPTYTRNIVHHRRRNQHLSRPRRQARHHPERDRSVYRRSGSASRASPFSLPSRP